MEKILFDFSEIQAKLLEFFLATPIDLREDLTELVLKKSNLDIESIEKVEAILKVKFPDSFKQIILQYDCGDLTLGGVWFGYQANYAEYLIKQNTYQIKDKTTDSYFATWWGDGERPSNYLSIGDSDGYVILLNIKTGEIMAYDRTESYQQAQIIASNLSIFLQAAATVYIRIMTGENKELLIDIPHIVGSVANKGFWKEIMLD